MIIISFCFYEIFLAFLSFAYEREKKRGESSLFLFIDPIKCRRLCRSSYSPRYSSSFSFLLSSSSSSFLLPIKPSGGLDPSPDSAAATDRYRNLMPIYCNIRAYRRKDERHSITFVSMYVL